jgi:hypothetical protein
VTTLQLFDEGIASAYDFKALVARFDAATQGRSRTEYWSAAQALAQVRTRSGGEPLGGEIAREYATSGTVPGDVPLAGEGAEERAALPGGDWGPPPAANPTHSSGSDSRHDGERGAHPSRDQRESHADLLEAYLERTPRYDFEALAREMERGDEPERALSALEIARRWERVSRYAAGLADERDEDARYGAARDWRAGLDLPGTGALGGGFGHAGSTGMTRGMANLKTLQGLEEGFHRLHP